MRARAQVEGVWVRGGTIRVSGNAGSGGSDKNQSKGGRFCPSLMKWANSVKQATHVWHSWRDAPRRRTKRQGKRAGGHARVEVGRQGRQYMCWALTNRANIFIVAVGHEVWSERELALICAVRGHRCRVSRLGVGCVGALRGACTLRPM
jgi:hypothetical protein